MLAKKKDVPIYHTIFILAAGFKLALLPSKGVIPMYVYRGIFLAAQDDTLHTYIPYFS